MEQKLAEFRARRQAEHAAKKYDRADVECSEQTEALLTTADSEPIEEIKEMAKTPTPTTPSSPLKQNGSDWMLDSALGRWLASRQLVLTNLTLLKVLLWLVLLGLFVEVEFGLPFFVLSLFYWLYQGLRSPAAREPGEMSAYSVFNPDCQPILGSLTAEQLEGEMGYLSLAH